jgi:hypothetical protein
VTEAEWSNCQDPTPLLHFLAGKVSERKLRLLACACCRTAWSLLTDPRSREAVEVAERYADGAAGQRELTRARGQALIATGRGARPPAAWAAYEAANNQAAATVANACAYVASGRARAAWLSAETNQAAAWGVMQAIQIACEREEAELARDIVGNPFHPASLDPAWLEWAGGLVAQLAEGIYEERAFDRLPILGDALEEAGCDKEEVLSHCRLSGEHVRGCWVVDLILVPRGRNGLPRTGRFGYGLHPS